MENSDEDVLQKENPDSEISSKSTKLPIKPRCKSTNKQLQEEELKVMKGIANSLCRSNSPTAKKSKVSNDGECESFGSYLSESLLKLDTETRHIVKYHINSILFQAQMGNLMKGQHQMVPQSQQMMFHQQFPSQVQQQFFPPSQTTSTKDWNYIQDH